MVFSFRRTSLFRRDFPRFGVAVATVAIGTIFLLVGTAQPTSIRMSRRIVAKPSKILAHEPEVKPAAAPRPSGSWSGSTACPQLNNPGGLRWHPAADAGPWPVNGVVHLPRFGVAAPIFKVGVNGNGEMELPHNARDVAWFDQGPYPGDTQNVVLAGHINYSGRMGSFGRIQQLRPGDVVSVEMDGKTYEYQVKWSCLFDRNTNLAEKIMGYTDVPSATLISCGGVFDRSAGTHNKRVAVRAELINQ